MKNSQQHYIYLNDCKQLLNQLGGSVDLNSRLICKISPHTPPTIIYKINIQDLENYPLPVLQTIYQRLKLIIEIGNI